MLFVLDHSVGFSPVISFTIFLFLHFLCYLILVLNNNLKETDHSFDICENKSVVHIY